MRDLGSKRYHNHRFLIKKLVKEFLEEIKDDIKSLSKDSSPDISSEDSLGIKETK